MKSTNVDANESLQTFHVCGSDAGARGLGIRKLLFCTIVMGEARCSETLLPVQWSKWCCIHVETNFVKASLLNRWTKLR